MPTKLQSMMKIRNLGLKYLIMILLANMILLVPLHSLLLISPGNYGTVNVSKKMYDTPILLLLNLNRMQYQEHNQKKDNHQVNYKFTLELNKMNILHKETPEIIYKLIGVVLHQGSPLSGHYIYLCRDAKSSWHVFNDEQVKIIETKEVTSFSNGYKGSFVATHLIYGKNIDALYSEKIK